MALKSKTDNELPEEFEVNEPKKISFEDLEFEAEYVDEEQTETRKFYTITGKESMYDPNWEIYKDYEADIDDWLEGYPEVRIIDKKADGKNYDALHIRIIDKTTNEVLDCYCNYPRADENGFVKGLNKDFDFYRNAFDFIFSVLKTRGEKYVLDKNGEEYNKFRKVDFIGFAKLVDQMSKVRIQITPGNEDSEYNSWQIIDME